MTGVPGCQPSLSTNTGQHLYDSIVGQLIRRVDDTICNNAQKDVLFWFQGLLEKYLLQELIQACRCVNIQISGVFG